MSSGVKESMGVGELERAPFGTLPPYGRLLTNKREPCNEGHMNGKGRVAKQTKARQRKCHLLALAAPKA